MAVLLPNGKQYYTTNGGLPLVDGKLYTYEAGTLIPKLTYSDAAATIPNSNPVHLDARGEAIIFWEGTYKVELRDSVDNVIWTIDNIVSSNETTSALIQEFRDQLADIVNPGFGDAMVGVKRVNIAAALAMTQHDWNEKARVNVLQMGVTGDGVTDDAPLLNTLGALGVPLFIPYTTTGYLIKSRVEFSCDVYCEGTFNPTVDIGPTVAIWLKSAGYPIKRKYFGIRVAGNVTVRAAQVSGIFNDCENSTMTACHVFQMDKGIIARSYSQVYFKCAANQCNTNFAAYARASNLEINALVIFGGNYDSPVNYSMNIGDTSFADSLPPGQSHGVEIMITGAVNVDGGPVKIDNVSAVHIDTLYSETSASAIPSAAGIAIILGGSGDGNCRNVHIENCFFKQVNYAVRCFSAVKGVEIGRNFYTEVACSALYLSSDLYPFSYETGDVTNSFTKGQELHTGFRSLPTNNVTFGQVTYPALGIFGGVQTVPADFGAWLPGGVLRTPTISATMVSSVAGRFYSPARTAKVGTVAGNVFTFTTLADCYAFNGGDRITTAPVGAQYVRSVDYLAGTMVIDGGVTAAGAATVTQDLAQFNSHTITFSGTFPTTGTWAKGDYAKNAVPAVGQPKGWYCTIAGTPGTWVSEGVL